ncbi:hypothetical protein G7B40_033965 [Aetokthonos hydrillicola Thurmond2011]|uniref:Uncharacterized protein n=1 Tax=Aetokthonos hydrillicola Thurmond2011 TaxID=2712845 RepID=A0AAP5IFM1_9CYAN|nr:hypothetical protein [Aetokthonos hydrillicola]MDR9899529.1 hypothetical protein [Aetokthonos hydrillicola Thurmond2011]
MFDQQTSYYRQSDCETDEQSYIWGFTLIYYDMLLRQQQRRHIELLEKNQTVELTAVERQELSELRKYADILMLQKAYAWSVLHSRGYEVPSLSELPNYPEVV